MTEELKAQPPGTVVQPCPLAKPEPTHWIEIELLGEDGKPIAGEAYRIRLTDGTLQEGNLDKDGRARWDGIPAGMCDVWWPNLGGITPVELAAPRAVASPKEDHGPNFMDGEIKTKGWVEIELVGEDGKPIAGERYEIRLPDGTVEQNVLDDYGRAFYDGIEHGKCEISFLDLSPGAWEPI